MDPIAALLRSPDVAAGYAFEWAGLSLLLAFALFWVGRQAHTREAKLFAYGAALTELAVSAHRHYWVLALWTAHGSERTAAWAFSWQWINIITVQVAAVGGIMMTRSLLIRLSGGCAHCWWGGPAVVCALLFAAGHYISRTLT